LIRLLKSFDSSYGSSELSLSKDGGTCRCPVFRLDVRENGVTALHVLCRSPPYWQNLHQDIALKAILWWYPWVDAANSCTFDVGYWSWRSLLSAFVQKVNAVDLSQINWKRKILIIGKWYSWYWGDDANHRITQSR
jgi:hypothetical protein